MEQGIGGSVFHVPIQSVLETSLKFKGAGKRTEAEFVP